MTRLNLLPEFSLSVVTRVEVGEVDVSMNFGPDQVLPATSHKTSDADGTVKIYRTEVGPSSAKPVSVYTVFKRTVEEFGDKTALLIKRDNEWREWSYKRYFSECCLAAKAMIKLGLERFHGVCIIGYNTPEWMISSFGCIFAGGFSAGVYTTNSAEACQILADNCKAQIIVVEDDSCLNKFLSVKRFLPEIKAIVQWNGLPGAPGVLSWAEFLAIGIHESDDELNRRLSLSAVNQCCCLIYTSGTTGPPKGVMLSQDNLTFAASIYCDLLDIEKGEGRVICYLPLSHLAAQMEDMYYAVTNANPVYFADRNALKGSLLNTLVEVQPVGFMAVPRVWEKFFEKLQEVGAKSGILTKSLGSFAKYHSLNYYNAVRVGRELSAIENMQYTLGKKMLLNRVKTAIGLGKARVFFSGTAPISVEILEYFMSLDIPIMEGYALSESLSICAFNQGKPGLFKLGSVGKVLPYTEVKLVNTGELREGEGEICMRGRNICMGYLRMPKATDEAIDEDGWLHSGDLGRLDSEGFLYITGRLKELVITSGGENIPPVLIEEAVKKELPCVSNAMLVGDKRNYLSMLLTFKSEVDEETSQPLEQLTPFCKSWMRKIGSKASTVEEAIKEIRSQPSGPLAHTINEGIKRYNSFHSFSNAQKVQKWRFLPHDFSLPTGELNNTLKLKRSHVLEQYDDLIQEMYSEQRDQLSSKL